MLVPDQDQFWTVGDLLVFTSGEGDAVAGAGKACSTLQPANSAKEQYFRWAGMQIPGDCQCSWLTQPRQSFAEAWTTDPDLGRTWCGPQPSQTQRQLKGCSPSLEDLSLPQSELQYLWKRKWIVFAQWSQGKLCPGE